jgi:hypothetical protein
VSPNQAVHCLVPHAVTARRTEPTGAASTVATHLPVVAWSAALISRGSRHASATAGRHGRVRDRGQSWEVFGMKVAVAPDPIAGTPMVVPMGRHHWDGTTR